MQRAKLIKVLTPTDYTKPIDHGCMGVGPNQTVWVQQLVFVEHDPG